MEPETRLISAAANPIPCMSGLTATGRRPQPRRAGAGASSSPTREHDAPGHPVVAHSHQRKTVAVPHRLSKVLDQGGDGRPMLTPEGLAVHLGNGLLILGSLLADLH